ncbi:helix-turn-helix domain-containing protein [Salmonella enterica]|nr:helix-turn-helix domain-containing protein [Salmonella enterica]EBS6878082.1 helix-turn-helix domain-containing protein [Salmonella enterica]EDU3050899.1 helix-turn-helix domain-containing protein [Salmonella enterica subsp. enterica serovar Thompson]EGH3413747.1 helix-turn-helix domain-containing protein [Salmonella enterica]
MQDLPEYGFVKMMHLADYFKVSDQTIYRWIRRDEFPRPQYLSDGVSRFDVLDVREWIKKRREEWNERRDRRNCTFKQMVETRKRKAMEKEN